MNGTKQRINEYRLLVKNMKTYEYKTETIWNKSDTEIMEWLNELGKDGWQLIKTKTRYGSDDEEYFFMREVGGDEE